MASRSKIVYSLKELKSFKEKNVIGECPLETSAYHTAKLNRIAASKQNGNINARSTWNTPSVNANSKVIPPHQNLNASPHNQSLSSKQQSVNDSRLLSKNDNEFTKSTTNIKSLNNKVRGNLGDERWESGLGSGNKDINNRDGNSGSGGGGGTSAEQQRLQFEREREQILLDRQKSKRTPSGGVINLIASESSSISIGNGSRVTNNGSTTGSYHNDCDSLMDELANNNEGNSNVTGSHDTNNKSGNLGLQANDKNYSLLSPPGTKKISLNSIFASSSSSSQPAQPPEPIIPVANIHVQTSKGGNNGTYSQEFGTKSSVHEPKRLEEEETHIGDISIDEDFEASMRLIERMVFDDKEDDTNGYDTTSQAHPSSQYSFFDGPSLLSTNMSTLEQPVSSVAGSSPAVSLSVNSLFKAAILKSEGETSMVRMSPSQPRSLSMSSPPPHMYERDSERRGRSFSERSESFDVLSKLGFESQMLEQKKNYSESQEYASSQSPAPKDNRMQHFSHVNSTPSKLPSNDNLNTSNEKINTGSTSPFAFHSNNGGGSSGGGSKRGNGNLNLPASSSSSSTSSTIDNGVKTSPRIGGGSRNNTNISASSRLQLMKMLKSPSSTPVKTQTHASISKTTGDAKVTNGGSPAPLKSSAKIVPLGGAKSEIVPVMQRINIGDLFKNKADEIKSINTPIGATAAIVEPSKNIVDSMTT